MHYLIRLCVLACLLPATVAFAALPDASLSLSQAVARVLESNPQLQAADFEARAALERVRQESQSTPYELGVELENLGGSGELSGARSLETTLSLGRVLEPGDKSARRGEVAELEAGLLNHDQDAERLELLAETARRFLAMARVQAERELAVQRVELLQRTLQSVEQRQRVGKAPPAERSRVLTELARAELALEETAHLLKIGRHQLAALWGVFEPDFSRVQADLFHLEAEPDFAALDRMIERNPTIARLATRARLGDARLLLARTRARPDLDLRAGVQHFNAGDDVGLMLSLRMPLGSGGRSRAWVNEAEVLAAREPLLAQEQRLALRTTLFALHQELLHARDRFETYRERVIPAADQTLDDYSRGYAAGRYSLLELGEVRNTLLEARLELLSAATEHHAARIEIDRLIGIAPLNGANP
ncbi:MAG: TolC family protein [Thiogranum sp.]|nr:TolC family protein [Thiogranum sp.]